MTDIMERPRGDRAKFALAPGLPWKGGGPWRILEGCPSTAHNSYWAYYAENYTDSRHIARREACICPGSKVLRDRRMAERRELEMQRKRRERSSQGNAEKPPPRIDDVLPALPEGVNTVDLSAGSCNSKRGQKLVDAMYGSSGGASTAARASHRAMCNDCPVLNACRSWISRAEGNNPGSFGGMYGGMTAAERREQA